jgi:hypothetical protein
MFIEFSHISYIKMWAMALLHSACAVGFSPNIWVVFQVQYFFGA